VKDFTAGWSKARWTGSTARRLNRPYPYFRCWGPSGGRREKLSVVARLLWVSSFAQNTATQLRFSYLQASH
jgi:hypothetical protein